MLVLKTPPKLAPYFNSDNNLSSRPMWGTETVYTLSDFSDNDCVKAKCGNYVFITKSCSLRYKLEKLGFQFYTSQTQDISKQFNFNDIKTEGPENITFHWMVMEPEYKDQIMDYVEEIRCNQN